MLEANVREKAGPRFLQVRHRTLQIGLVHTCGNGVLVQMEQDDWGDRIVKRLCVEVLHHAYHMAQDKVTLAMENGKTKEVRIKDVPVYKRGSQGVILSKRSKIVNIL